MPTISHWRCGRRAALDLGGRPQGRCAIARMRAEGFAPAAVVETIRRRQEGSRTGIVWIGFPPAYLSMLPAPGLGVRFELGNAGQDDGRPARGQGIQLPETSFRPWATMVFRRVEIIRSARFSSLETPSCPMPSSLAMRNLRELAGAAKLLQGHFLRAMSWAARAATFLRRAGLSSFLIRSRLVMVITSFSFPSAL